MGKGNVECKDGVCYLTFDDTSKTETTFNAANYVEDLIKNNDVVIFSKTYCPYCDDAKDIFKRYHVEYVAPELDKIPNGKQIHDYVKRKTDEPTVPNMFIRQKHIGGHEDLVELEKNGQLKQLLKK